MAKDNATCETVQIQTSYGVVTINKSDFDSTLHKLVGEAEAEAVVIPPVAELVESVVTKENDEPAPVVEVKAPWAK